MNRIQFLGIPIDNLTMAETLEVINNAIEQGEQLHHVVVNAGKVVAMQSDALLKESVVNSHLINADGQAVVWASKLLGTPLKERVAGIDLMESLVKLSSKNNYKIFFLGATEDIVKTVVERYAKEYGQGIIAGYRNGYFKKNEEEQIAEQISQSGAQLLFVAISSPKKEKFLYEHRDLLVNVNLIMGVGGSFDVVAGKVKRAPVWMQKTGLEWFYRFLQEPQRMWKRYLVGNTKFILLVLRERVKF
ncbi:WecB/TagA/CpsF family glycosyltransferase [Muricauda sp. MAR_2010_75]|uniref:WecB/TagA/CpsF family glycosyltransferase n=1 Tax=Allomuricauda sp. MAR_2010_75 TaxID=1250232 RepID=UPI000562B45F|nr:WecB/TagA/CpsF family glycosyltransferase [Muricauda sp. MAR_2010_75]